MNLTFNRPAAFSSVQHSPRFAGLGGTKTNEKIGISRPDSFQPSQNTQMHPAPLTPSQAQVVTSNSNDVPPLLSKDRPRLSLRVPKNEKSTGANIKFSGHSEDTKTKAWELAHKYRKECPNDSLFQISKKVASELEASMGKRAPVQTTVSIWIYTLDDKNVHHGESLKDVTDNNKVPETSTAVSRMSVYDRRRTGAGDWLKEHGYMA